MEEEVSVVSEKFPLAQAPNLPLGAKTWSIHAWPTWSDEQIDDAFAPLVLTFHRASEEKQQQLLVNMLQSAGLLLMLTGQQQHRSHLCAWQEGEGFEWVIQTQAPPWMWPAREGAQAAPSRLPREFVSFASSLRLALPQQAASDETATWAALTWFSQKLGLLLWAESRVKSRLGGAYRTGILSLGVGDSSPVFLVGRRYGPSLANHY